MCLSEQIIDRKAAVRNAVIEKSLSPPDVGVAFDRGDLLPANQQHAVVVELVLHHLVERGGRVVVGHRQEVESLGGGCSKQSAGGQGTFTPALAFAHPIRDSGVRVEIAFVPSGFRVDDLVDLGVKLGRKMNLHRKVAVGAGGDIVVPDRDVPGPGRIGPGRYGPVASTVEMVKTLRPSPR